MLTNAAHAAMARGATKGRMDSFGQIGEMATFDDTAARDGLWLSLWRGVGSKTARKTPNRQLAVTARNCVTVGRDGRALASASTAATAHIRKLANKIDSHYIAAEPCFAIATVRRVRAAARLFDRT